LSRRTAELAESVALVEGAAQDLGNRENVLTVRHWGQNLLLDPIAVDQHPLLVAGGAEAVESKMT